VKRAIVILGIGAALLLAACAPPPPPPANPATASRGFDACAAPSASTMNAWRSSPFGNVGVYIGGANRGCSQPNLTSSWVGTVTGQGWRLLPIWVGPQAPCSSLGGTTKLSGDPGQAYNDGVAQGNAAANAAAALGLGSPTPIYYDMEAYPRGGQCSLAVQNFLSGWVGALFGRGHQAGLYSSLCSGILDAAATVGNPAYAPLHAIWVAAWNNTPNLYGFTSCGGSSGTLSDSLWTSHQRIHQYTGGHNETYSGVTINIDSNAVDAPGYP